MAKSWISLRRVLGRVLAEVVKARSPSSFAGRQKHETAACEMFTGRYKSLLSAGCARACVCVRACVPRPTDHEAGHVFCASIAWTHVKQGFLWRLDGFGIVNWPGSAVTAHLEFPCMIAAGIFVFKHDRNVQHD